MWFLWAGAGGEDGATSHRAHKSQLFFSNISWAAESKNTACSLWNVRWSSTSASFNTRTSRCRCSTRVTAARSCRFQAISELYRFTIWPTSKPQALQFVPAGLTFSLSTLCFITSVRMKETLACCPTLFETFQLHAWWRSRTKTKDLLQLSIRPCFPWMTWTPAAVTSHNSTEDLERFAPLIQHLSLPSVDPLVYSPASCDSVTLNTTGVTHYVW